MWFAAKALTVIDVLARPPLRRAYGGALRFLASVAAEAVFSLLMLPILWLCHTLFLAGLPFGRAIGWIGQTARRSRHSVVGGVRQLWPQYRAGRHLPRGPRRSAAGGTALLLVLLAGGLVLSIPVLLVC